MSSPYNPYQPPQPPQFAGAQGFVTAQVAPEGLWRKGNLLVMDKRAQLPPRCIKSNMPAERWLKRNLSWHHPAVSISILASPLIYIILAAVLSKKATINIGLTDEWYGRRRMRIIITWLLVLASGGMLLASCVLMEQVADLMPLLMLAGFLLFIGALIFGVLATRIVTPAEITDHHVFLKGVHAEFLAGLPDWPYA